MPNRDLNLAVVDFAAGSALQLTDTVKGEDDVLQRILVRLFVHTDPDGGYNINGIHPSDLVSQLTTGGFPEILDSLSAAASSIKADINDELEELEADVTEFISAVRVTASDLTDQRRPRILISVTKESGATLSVEVGGND